MIICHCHRVTDSQARAACSEPDSDWRAAVKATGAATTCGGCVRLLRRAVEDTRTARLPRQEPVAQTVVHAG
ncbi:MAG TPA: (2Fe-2S)-binding protein [Frankiaceae bacterium]|nr:(2Fe-2S)-binding protein [Frankiaceae bacterium]